MKTFKELASEYKELLEVNMSKANRSMDAKKMAKKKAAAKAKKKCSGNMTASIETHGTNVKVKCTPKDKTKGRTMKKAAKKMKSNPAAMRKKSAKASATKAFRK
jgi:hypothetical protein